MFYHLNCVFNKTKHTRITRRTLFEKCPNSISNNGMNEKKNNDI